MDDRTLITSQHPAQVTAALDALPDGATPSVLEHEPVLRDMISEHFQRAAGQLVLCDAPKPRIHSLVAQMDRVVAIALTAQRLAYQKLLDDVVPDDASPDRSGDAAAEADDGEPRHRREVDDDGTASMEGVA